MSNNGAGGVFAVLISMLVLGYIAAMILMVLLVYAVMIGAVVLAFISFAWTFVCLIAWKRPLRLGWFYLDPVNARAFVLRGLFGALVLPLFLAAAHFGLDLRVNWTFLPHFMAAGYSLMSAGLEFFAQRALRAQNRDEERALPLNTIEHAQPQRRALATTHSSTTYATWDDEEDRR